MIKGGLKEMVRLSYLAGVNDVKNDCDQWCTQGSSERAEDLMQEFESEAIEQWNKRIDFSDVEGKQLISEKAIKHLFDNYPEAYEAFYDKL